MNQDFSNLNMGAGQPSVTNPESIYQAQQTQGPSQTQQVTGQSNKDSIEKAAALVASLYLPPMSNPLLIPPDPNLAVMIGQLAMDKICLNILDSWSKNLQKIAEEKKEADRRDELNPILREIHVTAGLILAVSTIFVRAIFGTQVAEALQKPENTEKTIAVQYATKLNQWALEGTLKGYLMTIVDELPSSANLNEAQKTILANQIQVMLLSSALAGLYKLKTQWITSDEFINLLSHADSLNDPQASLLAMLIVNTLAELPEAERIRMAKTLSIYMDSNPELPTLFDLNQTADIQLSILHSSHT